ncbi:hypothetical protein TNIN_267431 [Trichonephila inaurata madagascariensis]|uniref:Uncharacterized protein n=1 Tax=Trichonephila inaurata madagascariensis TaxID=2747483 RepID=A0A8X6Y7I2_9ARAC|nr:hypothetical protein TNIN_267431 [Trichonephila inaurata madagascariensis]
MTTESFQKGRFKVETLSDDELPEGFLDKKVHYMPRAGSGQQTQLPSSEFHLPSVDSPSGSSTQEVADTVAPTPSLSVESSTEYFYVEPIIHVVHPAGIQLSTSSDEVPMEITPEQASIDNGAKRQEILSLEEIGCIDETDEDYIPSWIKRERGESGKFEEISPDAQTSSTNESFSPLLGVSGVMDNGSQRQPMGCFERHVDSYIKFVKEFRNSSAWLAFLCLLLVPTVSGIIMGILYNGICDKPFDISKLTLVNGFLSFLCVVCHIAYVATKRFAPSLKIPLFQVMSVITISMVAVLKVIEFIYLPKVDPSGSCLMMYYYMFYMNIAYVVVMFAVTMIHLDLLYYACCPQYNCMSSAQTED